MSKLKKIQKKHTVIYKNIFQFLQGSQQHAQFYNTFCEIVAIISRIISMGMSPDSSFWAIIQIPGPRFNIRKDVFPLDLVKSRSREICI